MKKNNGITLVALVITVIILLILAGISISAVTQTGLFGKAKQATEKYALVTGMTAGGYCFLLLAGGILFYESNFQNIHLHMLAIAAGGILACVIALRKCGRRQRKRTASR